MKQNVLMTFAIFFLFISVGFAAEEKAVTSWQTADFGTELVNAKGENVSPDSLKGKIVGIYYSAQWCPPCRAFTPQLVKFYHELKAQGKAFEIVFVSFDRKAEDMSRYMTDTEMPWLAIPYSSAKKDAIKKKFQVHQIPTLLVLNDKGQILSTSAQAEVTEKGAAIYDAWANTQIAAADIWYEQVLGKQLTDSHKDTITTDILRGKIVGVYHSASWCRPCRAFTPELVKFYDALKKLHKKFEIILVDEDETKEAMIAYMKEDKMQWLALPFDKELIKNAWGRIAAGAKVEGSIPALVVFGPDGRVISSTGRQDLLEYGDEAFKIWSAKGKESTNP